MNEEDHEFVNDTLLKQFVVHLSVGLSNGQNIDEVSLRKEIAGFRKSNLQATFTPVDILREALVSEQIKVAKAIYDPICSILRKDAQSSDAKVKGSSIEATQYLDEVLRPWYDQLQQTTQ